MLNAQEQQKNAPFIRQLPDYLVNQIAAGEVIERPAAAVKELVENAIDAGATQIDIDLRDGGKSLIIVRDNGCGMSADDLSLSTERHATSKLPQDDLVHIHHLGFRGEALPSIGSVSRLNITSKQQNEPQAWSISIEGGRKSKPVPAAHGNGTTIEIRDLFYATPARLKFLKSARSEYAAVKDMLIRIAMAFPAIGFTLSYEGQRKFNVKAELLNSEDAQQKRLNAILGKDWMENNFPVSAERDTVKIDGFCSVPTLNRATTQYQFLYVNGRPVKDRLLLGCVRAAYMDVLHSGRHPFVVLYLTLPPEYVDVNVHPAKAEVRFRDAGHVRGLIITAIKAGLVAHGQVTSSTLSHQALDRLQQTRAPSLPYQRQSSPAVPSSYIGMNESAQRHYEVAPQNLLSSIAPSARYEIEAETKLVQSNNYPLGTARAQFHQNYILAQTQEGIILVDQHAAHERIVYEKLKQQMAEGQIAAQGLLVPEILDLDDTKLALLEKHQSILEQFGLQIEPFGQDTIAVQSLPALLGAKIDIKKLVFDIVDELDDFDTAEKLQKSLFEKLSSAACHGSIRSGRWLNLDEMNALLRQMEQSPNFAHCNHGRPTYITLNLNDIEKLFGRR